MQGMVDMDSADMIALLEECRKHYTVVQILVGGQKEQKLLPHYILYLDGELTLLGENVVDRSLKSIFLKDLCMVLPCDDEYDPNFSVLQVEQYVKEMREMNDRVDRLVLKIKAGHSLVLEPPFQLLINSCVVPTPSGDLIWAATLEIHPSLFRWLFEFHDLIEIIAPEYFKYNFLVYTQSQKLQNKRSA